MSRVKTSFVLHSKRHRHLYPKSRYPLTHLIDRQNVARHCRGQNKKLRRALYSFLCFLAFTLFACGFFRTHVHLFNQLLGPFDVDQTTLAIHVNNYDQNALWWSLRKEYFQVELGEDNIRNPESSAETIRRYSDSETRRNHVATYKRVSKPWMYVKLPTRTVDHFHRQFPFNFRLFSMSALRCVVERLASDSNRTYERWIEKDEYVRFIDDEYSRNATRFNSLVLSKCGVLVGHLYRPEHELAFLPTRDHQFRSDDIALDVTSPYASSVSLFMQTLPTLLFLVSGIYYLVLYLPRWIRVRFLHPRGLFAFPLEFSADVVEELFLLNSEDPVERQLLQLDSYLQRSEHRLLMQMFVIENNFEQSFVILLEGSLNGLIHTLHRDKTPFVICPVTDIQRIVHDQGICYGPNASWIPWPAAFAYSPQNYSEWLHQALMEISAHYRQRLDLSSIGND